MRLVELFEPLLGQWQGVEQHTLAAGADAGPARAMLVLKLDLAGTAVLQDYRRVRDDGAEFTAHGVFLVTEPPAGLGWWRFDSDGGPPTTASGGRVDDELVFSARTPEGTVTHRFRIDDAGRLINRVDLDRTDRADPEPLMVGAYQRISGH